MDQYFERMKVLMANTELPLRIRFKLQDVIELREAGVSVSLDLTLYLMCNMMLCIIYKYHLIAYYNSFLYKLVKYYVL